MNRVRPLYCPAPEAAEAINFPLVGSGAAYCRTACINQLNLTHINI